jgi:hypothetical protein
MSKKFIYVDVSGDYTESEGFESSDFVASSAGVGDAGKPIKTGIDGKIDGSFLDSGDVDHGGLAGLGDDDHTQYSLVSGTRAYTGVVAYTSHPTFNNDFQLVDKKYVDDMINSEEWQDSVITRTATPPVAPVAGDRYLVLATATGAWAGMEGKIAQYNGTSWVFTTATTGTKVSVDEETDGVYLYTGSVWEKKFYETTTASSGVKKVGVDIQADLATSGGLKLISGQIAVEPNDFAGEGLVDVGDDLAIDWSTAFNDSKAIKASDLNSQAAGKGASIIGIHDASSYFVSTNVEDVLGELYGYIVDAGTMYNVGVGGVAKGDVVAITANNTVVRLNPSVTSHRAAIGIALETKSAGQTVKILANDTIVTGIISGATAGTQYFWNGSAHSTTAPTGSGAYVFRTGFAKNASDLHIELDFIKRNG